MRWARFERCPLPTASTRFERYHPDGAVQVHLNFGEEPSEVVVPEGAGVLLSTAGKGSALRAGLLELGGYEGVIVR